MNKIIKYILLDILRNKIVIGYTALLALISFSVFNLEDNASKGILTLLNIISIILPMFSIVFSTIYLYNAGEFIELLISQPLKRRQIWLSLYAGLATSLCLAYFIGCGIPLLLYSSGNTGMTVLAMGLLTTLIFIAIAFMATVYTRDKARGIGAAILLWLYFTLIFDGLVLFLMFQLMDYPLEVPMIIASLLNPIDLSRIVILLQLDISVLMGATSAVFKDFLGTNWGIACALATLLTWAFLPLWLSNRKFNRKDL